jgi:hypothetical protein
MRLFRSEVVVVLAAFASLLASTVNAADKRAAAVTADTVITAQQVAFFETKIRPVLIERCVECHSGDEPESGLKLESRADLLRGGELGTALLPGKPKQSLLISALKHDEFIKMPPKEKLPTQQVVDFTRWVEMGAPWPNSIPTPSGTETNSAAEAEPGQQFTAEQRSHWAFQPVAAPTPPELKSAWPQSPIDLFILRQLNTAKLQPAPPANKRTLLRRATFDLTGLPPTPSEVESFLLDESSDAFAKVVDRLLASPRYGEHWGRHWLDVVRYADSNGLDENLSYANAFRYRDYVISAFNEDKPYARFVQEQIAGDLLPELNDERQDMDRYVATGFLAIGPKMLAEDDPMKMQMDIIDEQLSTLGQTFMGLTLGCARCHDHKFDPLPTEDYYSLAGIFKSSKTMENHNVVAVWYERPLVSTTVTEQIAAIDKEVAETTSKIEQLKADQRTRIGQHVQDRFGQYLLANAALDRLQKHSRAHREGLTASEVPLPVHNGSVLFEAEAFHRGNVERLSDGYGEGIGIIATRGAAFAEYDFAVERAGKYGLEIRYAAAESRPLNVIVNGETLQKAVAGQVTGSWYPDTQRWFAAGQFELKAGKNTLKLDSAKVYPHIDQLQLVYVGPEPWPYPTPPPMSTIGIAADHQVNPELAFVWQEFLKQVDEDKLIQFPSFSTWLAFARLDTASFAQEVSVLLNELSSPDGLGATTPSVLKQSLLQAQPQSLADVAGIYQEVLNTLRENAEDDDELMQEWYLSPSPLLGPSKIVDSMLPPESRQQFQALQDRLQQLTSSRPTYDVAMGVTEAAPESLRVHLRGSHIALGKAVPRRFPRIISGVEQLPIGAQESGRLQLAKWLSSPNHPLTGRVLVNRVWHWRFGRGISPSVDNFGLLGQPPTHPQLLDWLTRRFLENDGSIKQLHRLMMLSSTYQMSTQFSEASNKTDPENNFLWRFRRRRLTGEEIRDSLIALGTGLEHRIGGSLLKIKNRAYVTVSGTNLTDEFDSLRRSVYLPVVRSAVYQVLQTFDFPDPAVAAGVRQTSTVAPQALMMMNSELVEQQTLAMAQRLLTVPSVDDRIFAAFDSALNRKPNASEIETGRQYVLQAQRVASTTQQESDDAQLQAWQSYCRVLLSSNEFAYVE